MLFTTNQIISEIVHMMLSEAAERYDAINKQQARVMTLQLLFSREWKISCLLSRECLLLMITYRYLQIIM
jgi:hypothetical protein